MPYEPRDFLTVPKDGATIWRYVNLFQLISLLANCQLYFVRLTLLQEQDLFEGTFPLRLAEEIGQGVLRAEREELIPTFYVSCWHVNQHESMAMWRLYAKGGGLALQTTFGDFKRAFKAASQAIHIGLVRYLDYDSDPIGDEWAYLDLPVVLKRKSFAHENELRAYFSITDFSFSKLRAGIDMPHGIPVDIELPLLIRSVYVAPGTPDWQIDAVNDLLRKYGYCGRVIRSRLDDRNQY